MVGWMDGMNFEQVVLVKRVEEVVCSIVGQAHGEQRVKIAFWGVGNVVVLCCDARNIDIVNDVIPAGVSLLGISNDGSDAGSEADDDNLLHFMLDGGDGHITTVRNGEGRVLPIERVEDFPWDRIAVVYSGDYAVEYSKDSLELIKLGKTLFMTQGQCVKDEPGARIETFIEEKQNEVLEKAHCVRLTLMKQVRMFSNIPEEKKGEESDGVSMKLRVLCYVLRTTPAHEVARMISKHVSHQMTLAQQLYDALLSTPAASLLKGRKAAFETRFVRVPELPIVLELATPCSSAIANSPVLSNSRRALQQALCLGTERPLINPMSHPAFRLGFVERAQLPQQLLRPCDRNGVCSGNSVHLMNVADSTVLQKHGVRGGEAHLVKGNYAYYHYEQDCVNDSGWGCAYRSLQTLCSWLLLQRYTSKPVPTHGAVQQLLVDLGDKPTQFAGSREWIGAVEISLCLQSMYGVDCRVLHVPKGREVPTHARELAEHFDTEGTPIMIGGGVLAYTLLGISWNEFTGETQYLILDPHYTGADKLEAVVSHKNGCSWRGADIFLKDKFYNFCMPLHPHCF